MQQKLCNTRLTKESYDSHTVCIPCRGQTCSVDLHCEEFNDWDIKKWKTLDAHLKKLARDRKRKAIARESSKALSSQDSPTKSDAIAPVISSDPIPFPPPVQPSPLPGSHVSVRQAGVDNRHLP